MKYKQTSSPKRKGVGARGFENTLPLDARIGYVDGLVSKIRELIDTGQEVAPFIESNEDVWKTNEKRFRALLANLYETNITVGFSNFHAMEQLRSFLVEGDEGLEEHFRALEAEKAPTYRDFLANRKEEREHYEQEFNRRANACNTLLPRLGWEDEEISLFLDQYRRDGDLPPSESEIIENAFLFRMDEVLRARVRRTERKLREAGFPLDS